MNTSSLSLSQITKPLSQLLHRFHVILFALLVIGGLSVATFLLYGSIVTSSAPDQQVTSSSSFDKTTIEKIKTLRDPSQPGSPLQLPAGRTNPFE